MREKINTKIEKGPQDVFKQRLDEILYKKVNIESINEFSEKPKFLESEYFEAGVSAAYKEAGSPGSVRRWYETEYKQNQGWPANPNRIYQDKGWVGFPELVGKEKINKSSSK